MKRVLMVVGLLVLPVPALAQMTYEQRAAMAADTVFQNRVGIAAQQQAVVVQGENPVLCCQISTQQALVFRGGKQTLCDLTTPAGDNQAAQYIKDWSTARHNSRAQMSQQVLNTSREWALRMAGIIASDSCITATTTDVQLQTYMTRLWDLYALSPQLAATPVEGVPVPTVFGAPLAPLAPPVMPVVVPVPPPPVKP